MVLSEGSLNSILSCPMFGASLVNGSLGKGKDRPFDEHFDYILKLNHGVLHANQAYVYRRNLIVTISDEAWDKLKTQTLKSGSANSSFSSLPAFLRTKFQEMVYLRKFKQSGRT